MTLHSLVSGAETKCSNLDEQFVLESSCWTPKYLIATQFYNPRFLTIHFEDSLPGLKPGCCLQHRCSSYLPQGSFHGGFAYIAAQPNPCCNFASAI